jgi:FKBP-type peptidyl-prolyl cis-trans isomerase
VTGVAKQFTCLLALLTLACGGSPPEDAALKKEDIKGLITKEVRVGDGNEATFGRDVLVHYTGWVYDEKRSQGRGREFDSSRDRNEPLPFKLGAGEVIRGWDEGVNGMKVGGRRTLTIPPEMAYGAEGLGELIPPNATLIFDVELIDVK